jgi:rhodanese-related sulfurtransferase
MEADAQKQTLGIGTTLDRLRFSVGLVRPRTPMTSQRLEPRTAIAMGGRALLLLAASGAMGLLVNRFHPKGVPVAKYIPATMCSATQEAAVAISELAPSAAAQLCGTTSTLVADVRSAEEFAKGHIAGAIHIPCSGTTADLERVRVRLLGKDRLVVYGGSDEQSRQVAADLSRRVQRPELQVATILGGWPAWFDAGLACSSGPCDDCGGEISDVRHESR